MTIGPDQDRETKMPVAYADIPAGVNDGAKKKIFQELYEEIHQAWPIPDTRVLITEWPNEAVSQDGQTGNVPMRPICTLAVPPGLEHDAQQRLARQLSNTIGEACGRQVEEIPLPRGTKIYNNWVLTFFWELPLDKVALGDLIAAENPLILENLPPSNDAAPAAMPPQDAPIRCRMLASSSRTGRRGQHLQRPRTSVAGAAVPSHRKLATDLPHPPHQQRPGTAVIGTSGHPSQRR